MILKKKNRNIPLKALLLSAGLGTRLRPLTLDKPKCLIEIKGEPILEYWLKILEKLNVEEVVINTHYLHYQVRKFIQSRNCTSLNIYESFEKQLLGTAGTLINNIEFFKGSIGLIIHSDNYTKADLSGLINAHMLKPKNCLLTMLTFNTNNPSSCGIVEVENKIVKRFYEKVSNPPCKKANGAIYVFDDIFLEWLNNLNPKPTDFSTEVIPLLMDKIFTWHTEEYFLDIGTPSALNEARHL